MGEELALYLPIRKRGQWSLLAAIPSVKIEGIQVAVEDNIYKIKDQAKFSKDVLKNSKRI